MYRHFQKGVRVYLQKYEKLKRVGLMREEGEEELTIHICVITSEGVTSGKEY